MVRMVALGSSYVDGLGDRSRIVEARVRGKPNKGRANLDGHATSDDYAYIKTAKYKLSKNHITIFGLIIHRIVASYTLEQWNS
jgi:hypothetical protein